MEGDDLLLAETEVKVAPKRDEWMTTLPPERKVRSFFFHSVWWMSFCYFCFRFDRSIEAFGILQIVTRNDIQAKKEIEVRDKGLTLVRKEETGF